MEKKCEVLFSRFAEKQEKRLPFHIREALQEWIAAIEKSGFEKIRSIPGYHDEPLKGSRFGQRSARLNRSYRVIYEEHEDGQVIIVVILEVNKHDY